MRHRWDRQHSIYRTELQKAGVLDYVLMLVFAFVLGAAAVVLLMWRAYVEAPPPSGEETYVGATPEVMAQVYREMGVGALVGGTLATVAAAILIGITRREIREREERRKREQLTDVRKVRRVGPRDP